MGFLRPSHMLPQPVTTVKRQAVRASQKTEELITRKKHGRGE